jgi:hypothetical protein
MASLPTSDRWWPRFVVLVLVAMLIGPGASFVFDRNGDGIDDGGLALCLPEPLEFYTVTPEGFLRVTLTKLRPEQRSRVRVNLRSPPSSSSGSR